MLSRQAHRGEVQIRLRMLRAHTRTMGEIADEPYPPENARAPLEQVKCMGESRSSRDSAAGMCSKG